MDHHSSLAFCLAVFRGDAAGNDASNPELLCSLGAVRQGLRFIRHRERAVPIGGLQQAHKNHRCWAVPTADPQEALKLIKRGRCRLAMVDVRMPAMDCFEFLSQALQSDPGANILLMTGDYTLDSALEAIRRGATDFLPKPIDRAHLKKTLDDAAKLYDQRRRVRVLEEQLLKDLEFHGIVGKRPAMLEVFDFARKVARAIHQLSSVSQQKLAVCNCSALVDTQLESQLFGHMRGAFTGATDTRPGLFEYAKGGTVFLDEVGEMSLAMQAKLLRVIQNREIQRVGSPEVRQVNVRLIAATNPRFARGGACGAFPGRSFLPPELDSDPDSVAFGAARGYSAAGAAFPAQIQCGLRKTHCGADAARATLLLQHPRPGNVCELENVISSACITTTGDFLDLGDLPEHLLHRGASGLHGDEWRPLSLEEVRMMHIQRVLEMCQGNRLRAAQILGIGRTSLYRYLKRDGYDTNKAKPGSAEV